MEQLQSFTKDNLPSYFAWQLRDFARLTWYADMVNHFDETLHPESWHPRYFVLSHGKFLMSSATVLWKTISFQGISYKMYGLGLVLTYPAHRKQGYGRQVVSAATEYIQHDTQADMALLQTMPALEQFYGEHGWEYTPNIRVLSGSPENRVDDDGWVMMMFLSARAKQVRKQLEQTPFYFDEHIW